MFPKTSRSAFFSQGSHKRETHILITRDKISLGTSSIFPKSLLTLHRFFRRKIPSSLGGVLSTEGNSLSLHTHTHTHIRILVNQIITRIMGNGCRTRGNEGPDEKRRRSRMGREKRSRSLAARGLHEQSSHSLLVAQRCR